VSIGSSSSSLINLAIQFAGATSADEAGKEEKDDNKRDDTNDGEDPGNGACVMKETSRGLTG
jgi:hypothetical protein